MTRNESPYAWWARLRHQGLLLSPVVLAERFAATPPDVPFHKRDRLREARTRFDAATDGGSDVPQAAVLAFVDALLEGFVGHSADRVAKQNAVPENFTVPVRIGTRTETIRPHRVLYADEARGIPALLVVADPSPQVGRGRGRTRYAHLVELLRGTGHRLGLLTNGRQFRLVYAGLDFESWCEWESDRWFDDGEGTEELLGLRQLLSPETLAPVGEKLSGLLHAVEESRKKQADLSSVLRENVRQAVELLLDEVSTAHRTDATLLQPLVRRDGQPPLADVEAHEALLQATVRVVMRLVVCLFAESRGLLPVVVEPVYARSYGVRTLYELLDEAVRSEGGTVVLFGQRSAWPRLMALFRLVHGGSEHKNLLLRPYGGVLFRPGDAASGDPVLRALHVLEHDVEVSDATVFHVLRKLLRGPLPVVKGKTKTFVEGPVDYTDLRTEFIGLIYEGLLDYRLKRTDAAVGPQVFLDLGREPVLPLARLVDMLEHDRKGLKDLLATLKKEKAVGGKADEETEEEDDAADGADADDESADEIPIEVAAETSTDEGRHGQDYADAVGAAKSWAREAVLLAGLVPKQGKRETDAAFQIRVAETADRLIKRVVSVGEFYLVRAGNTRKGTGTFYTRPQLAVPTAHRTLEPLCWDKAEDGTRVPKTPEEILALKVCDPACGSASFLVAALHYLSEALYRSLCVHRGLDDPPRAKRITLPFGRPRTGAESEQLLPFPPDDDQRGEQFADRVQALLRRHVVERCLYGVDINPLAVEFARVSLWVETLDPELPFSFLDHKIKVGNALVGCWLDRVEDYPLRAWERNGGDDPDTKTKGPRTLRVETFLKGEKIGNRRSGDGIVKREMRQILEERFRHVRRLFADESTTAEQVVAEARRQYEAVHDLPAADPDERERRYREHVENSPPVRRLKAAMDEWCAVWFWPTDEESLRHVPTPRTFHSDPASGGRQPPGSSTSSAPSPRQAILDRLAHDLRFFHWEVEFPDVFTPDRRGFDALLGNPPWDVMKPNSQEFFTEFDPLYRTYDKQAALRRQQELFGSVPGLRDQWDEYNARFKGLSNWAGHVAEPFDVPLTRGKQETGLKSAWQQHRKLRIGFADPAHPFRLQGSADLNSYKLFTEACWHLLRSGGLLGLILPSGLYSDSGTKDLRETLLRHDWRWLFCFENKNKIFDIHRSFKFAPTIAAKQASTGPLNVAFMVHDLAAWERSNPPTFPLDPASVELFSPRSKSLPEVRTQRDLDIARTIYDHSIRIGDNAPGWEITYAREFDMTNDSKHFPPLEKWEAKGYRPDAFGRWIGPEGDVALPLYQGAMVHHFMFVNQQYVRGSGRSVVWAGGMPDRLEPRSQFLISESDARELAPRATRTRYAFRDISRSTDQRSLIGSVVPGFPCGNTLPTLTLEAQGVGRVLYFAGSCSSLVTDYVTRQRLTGTHLNFFIAEECTIPVAAVDDHCYQRLVLDTACLTFLHRRFAPEWLQLRRLYPELAGCEWKHWWAVTEADRLRLRVEIDALVADLYGLAPDDFDWIVRDDPTDPKGFYRVDRQLPFCERLTGLAAAAFRTLKEGKWSAESAASLSNDAFFDLLGIPELTDPAAAAAKGLPGPLILKRDGCHAWHPETFPPDDPRHGWTWDDCRADALALLGSEEAVRKYVEGEPEKPTPTPDGPTDLFGAPLPTDLFGHEVPPQSKRRKGR